MRPQPARLRQRAFTHPPESMSREIGVLLSPEDAEALLNMPRRARLRRALRIALAEVERRRRLYPAGHPRRRDHIRVPAFGRVTVDVGAQLADERPRRGDAAGLGRARPRARRSGRRGSSRRSGARASPGLDGDADPPLSTNPPATVARSCLLGGVS